MVEKRIDITESEGSTFFKAMTLKLQGMLGNHRHRIHKFDINIEKEIYATYDSLINYGIETLTGSFYNVRSTLERP